MTLEIATNPQSNMRTSSPSDPAEILREIVDAVEKSGPIGVTLRWDDPLMALARLSLAGRMAARGADTDRQPTDLPGGALHINDRTPG